MNKIECKTISINTVNGHSYMYEDVVVSVVDNIVRLEFPRNSDYRLFSVNGAIFNFNNIINMEFDEVEGETLETEDETD